MIVIVIFASKFVFSEIYASEMRDVQVDGSMPGSRVPNRFIRDLAYLKAVSWDF